MKASRFPLERPRPNDSYCNHYNVSFLVQVVEQPSSSLWISWINPVRQLFDMA